MEKLEYFLSVATDLQKEVLIEKLEELKDDELLEFIFFLRILK